MNEFQAGEGTCDTSVQRITFDLRSNTLRLVLAERPVIARRPVAALIDIGESGRLLGVELDGETGTDGVPLYLTLYASTDIHVRSIAATVQEHRDELGLLLAVEIPRRGHGYEIAYPSGNQ